MQPDPYDDDLGLTDDEATFTILALEDTEPVELDAVDLDLDGDLVEGLLRLERDDDDCADIESLEGPDVVLDEDPDGEGEPGLYGLVRGARINGFPVGSASQVGVRSFTVPGTKVRVPLRADVAPLLLGFAREFHLLVEPLRPGWCWGYAYRPVRGAAAPSFHAAAIALDLNAPKHPLGRRGTFTRRQAAVIRSLCRKYGLRWGGDYRRRADEMHVEVIVPIGTAREMVRRLQHAPAARPAATPARNPYPTLRLGAAGHAVRNVQDALRRAGNRHLKLDGKFGPETQRLIKTFQANRKLPATGVVDGATWAALRRVPR